MKQKNSRSAAVVIGAGLVLAFAGVASAGSKFFGSGSVVVTKDATGAGSATGLLGMIYNGTGKVEYIGCQKSSSDAVFCHAISEGGVYGGCSVNSAYLAQAVSTLATDARLTFRFDAGGKCTAITVAHSSEYQDKRG